MKYLFSLARLTAVILGLMMITPPLCAQTMHSGERTDDFTGIRRNMSSLEQMRCPTGKMAVGSTCVDVPATDAGLISGTLCGSVGRDWGGGWSNHVPCMGTNLISFHNESQVVWQPATRGCRTVDPCGGRNGTGQFFDIPARYVTVVTTVTDTNCPSGYQFMMTAHTNYGGVSGDDIFSCVKI